MTKVKGSRFPEVIIIIGSRKVTVSAEKVIRYFFIIAGAVMIGVGLRDWTR